MEHKADFAALARLHNDECGKAMERKDWSSAKVHAERAAEYARKAFEDRYCPHGYLRDDLQTGAQVCEKCSSP